MSIITNTRFTTNWNNKLFCKYFTTLRLWDETKYRVGEVHQIWFKELQTGRARVVDVRKITPDQINDWIGYLDTGYNADTTRNILHQMYRRMKKPIVLAWVMYEYEEQYYRGEFVPA